MTTNKQVWRDISASVQEWRQIGQEIGLNELQLMELGNHPQQSWVVDGDDWLTVNMVLPEQSGRSIKRLRLCVLLSNKEVVLLHEGELDAAIINRLKIHTRIGSSPTGVLAIVADVVTERSSPILDSIDDAIDHLEDAMVGKASDKQIHQLFHCKKLLSDLRRVVVPTMLTLNSLSDGRFRLIEKQYVPYLRDSYDYAWRAHELIDTQRDLLSSVLDTYLSVMSNHMNDIMKRLTIVTTLFMPITFLTGFGGMNFQQLPFGDTTVFYGILWAMVVIPVLMLGYFYHKKWF